MLHLPGQARGLFLRGLLEGRRGAAVSLLAIVRGREDIFGGRLRRGACVLLLGLVHDEVGTQDILWKIK